MDRKKSIGISILFLSLFHQSSHAISITWALQDVTFIDAATATGSFVHDADIFEVVSTDIEATPGSQTIFNSTPAYNVARSGDDTVTGSTIPTPLVVSSQPATQSLENEILTLPNEPLEGIGNGGIRILPNIPPSDSPTSLPSEPDTDSIPPSLIIPQKPKKKVPTEEPILAPKGWTFIPSPGSAIPQSTIELAKENKEINDNAKKLFAYLDSDENSECIDAVDSYLYDLSKLDAYAEKCNIKPFSELQLNDNILRDLKSRIGVFVNEDNLIFCNGLLLDNRSIVTARHCFFDRKLVSRSKFVVLDDTIDPIENYQISSQACGSLQPIEDPISYQACDYLILSIDEKYKVEQIARIATKQSISDLNRLIFVGYHKYIHADRTKVNPKENFSLGEKFSDWRSGVVWADNPLCSSYETRNVDITKSNGKTIKTQW